MKTKLTLITKVLEAFFPIVLIKLLFEYLLPEYFDALHLINSFQFHVSFDQLTTNEEDLYAISCIVTDRHLYYMTYDEQKGLYRVPLLPGEEAEEVEFSPQLPLVWDDSTRSHFWIKKAGPRGDACWLFTQLFHNGHSNHYKVLRYKLDDDDGDDYNNHDDTKSQLSLAQPVEQFALNLSPEWDVVTVDPEYNIICLTNSQNSLSILKQTSREEGDGVRIVLPFLKFDNVFKHGLLDGRLLGLSMSESMGFVHIFRLDTVKNSADLVTSFEIEAASKPVELLHLFNSFYLDTFQNSPKSLMIALKHIDSEAMLVYQLESKESTCEVSLVCSVKLASKVPVMWIKYFPSPLNALFVIQYGDAPSITVHVESPSLTVVNILLESSLVSVLDIVVHPKNKTVLLGLLESYDKKIPKGVLIYELGIIKS